MKKLLLITRPTDAAKLLEEAAQEAGLDVQSVSPESIYIADDGDNGHCLYAKGKKIEIPDYCMIRDGTFNMFVKRVIQELFTAKGTKVVNSWNAIENCRHKYLTQILLNKIGVKTPKTAFLSHMDQFEEAMKLLDDKFPKIVKTVTGSHGIGVIKVDSMSSLKSVMQVLLKTYDEIIIQDFLVHKEDFRILTINHEPVAFMRRGVPESDFRSNLEHQQNREDALTDYKPSEKELELATKISKALGTDIGASDYAIVDDEIIVFEVNTSPGLNGIQSVTKDINIAEKMIEFMMKEGEKFAKSDKDHTMTTPIILKRINSNDPFIAKIDTGAEKSWISGEDIEIINEKAVKFTLNGVRYIVPLVRKANIKFAGGTLMHKEVPIIKLDIMHNGKEVKDVEFIVHERKHKYTILLGRNLLTMLNMVLAFDGETTRNLETDEKNTEEKPAEAPTEVSNDEPKVEVDGKETVEEPTEDDNTKDNTEAAPETE